MRNLSKQRSPINQEWDNSTHTFDVMTPPTSSKVIRRLGYDELMQIQGSRKLDTSKSTRNNAYQKTE